MFYSVIRNELGEVVRYCKDYTDKQNDEYLENHIEYYLSIETIDEDFY